MAACMLMDEVIINLSRWAREKVLINMEQLARKLFNQFKWKTYLYVVKHDRRSANDHSTVNYRHCHRLLYLVLEGGT